MAFLVDFLAFLPPGQHPGMDALARGLACGVQKRGGHLRVRISGSKENNNRSYKSQDQLLQDAIDDAVTACYIFVTDPSKPTASLVQTALLSGIKIFTIHRPYYPVTGSIVVPNFYHGVTLANRMAQALLEQWPNITPHNKQKKKKESTLVSVAILGGPKIVDDEELVLGCLDGARRAGVHVLNDPFDVRYRNLEDIKGASAHIVQNIFQDYGEVWNGLIVFNDETLHDVIDYLKINNKTKRQLGSFPIVSRNGSPEAIEYVKDKLTTATLDYKLPEIGHMAATLLDCRDNEDQHHQHQHQQRAILGPFGTLYDSSNVASYRPWEERAPLDIQLPMVPNYPG